MASLLSGSQISTLTGIFARHFDTFSPFSALIVNKEPKIIKNSVIVNNYPGYSNQTYQENNTYVPVSGVFPAMVISDREQKYRQFPENQSQIPKGATKIKVKKEARDYIKNGRTESVMINDLTYNTITDDGFQNYLGLIYYYFILERTN